MKKKVIATVLVVVFLLICGLGFYVYKSYIGDNVNIYEKGIGAKFTQISLGEEFREGSFSFIVKEFKKVSDTKYSLILNEENYKVLFDKFTILIGKDNSIFEGDEAYFEQEVNETGDVTGLYFSLTNGNDGDISNKSIKEEDLQQIYFIPVSSDKKIERNFVLNLK